METIRLLAWAKINPCLEVLGRRDDGYHELATIFQSVMLGDELYLETRDESGITLSVPDGGAPEGPENLCWAAVEAYQRLCSWPEGVRIELRKRIPAGAGLAGGSSDAAAVLRALASIDPDPPALETLGRLAEKLGSDVHFCVSGGTALGRGRGEKLTEFTVKPAYWVCLVKPDFAVSTAEAYGMLSAEDFTSGDRALELADHLRAAEPLREWAHLVYNAFAGPLTRRWPVFGELKPRLRDFGALASEVSGSGSTVFGLFEGIDESDAAAQELARQGWWARSVTCTAAGCLPIERNGVEL